MARQEQYKYLDKTTQNQMLSLLPRGVKRVLDIGGGKGGTAIAVKQLLGCSIAATADSSEEAIDDAYPEVDIALVCNVEHAAELEGLFNDHGPFDLVLCLDVLEHLVDPWRVVAQLHQLMPRGGYILASIPNVQNYRCIIRTISGTWNYKDFGLFDRTHLRYFGKSSAVKLMTATGLKFCGVRKAFGPHKIDEFIDRISFGLLGRFVTMQHQILVQKLDEDVKDPGFCGSAIALR